MCGSTVARSSHSFHSKNQTIESAEEVKMAETKQNLIRQQTLLKKAIIAKKLGKSAIIVQPQHPDKRKRLTRT